MKLDVEMCDELLGTTRSVRKRLDLNRTVPRSAIDECLRLAIQAPTGSNSQTWRWIIVDDSDLRHKLADLYRKNAEPYLTTAVSNVPEGQTKRVFESALYLMNHLHEVPIHVIPCILGRAQNGPMSAGFFASIYPAVWNFQLALRARGLGSCLTTLHLGSAEEAAHLLDIPEDVSQVALLPVAWTIGTSFKRAVRKPIENFSYWNKFVSTA